MSRVMELNEAEVNAYFDDVEEELFGDESAVVRGTLSTCELVTLDLEKDAPHNPDNHDYDGNPWNLAASIGVDERIPAAKAKIPGLKDRRDYQVELDGSEVSAVIGLGMLYADKLKNYPQWYLPAFQRLDRVWQGEVQRELDVSAGRVA
jgi:hypothetical protein